MPTVNQFNTDDEPKNDELIENEIFLSPIVESNLGGDTAQNTGRRQDGEDYLLSPDAGDDPKVVTRRSSKNELGLSLNSHNKITINYEMSNPPDSSMNSGQSLRFSKFCTQCGF